MKACIAVGEYYKPSETFVNRHIERLFGGDTVVIASRVNALREVDGRFLDRNATKVPLVDRALRPLRSGLSTLRYASGSVPAGVQRRRIEDFLRLHQPDLVLSEFGTQAVPLAPVVTGLGIPMFTYFRGADASAHLRSAKHRRAYVRLMPQLAGVFAVSQFLLDNLAEAGAVHRNAHVIPSGVDVRRFQPGTKVPLSCLAVGRFIEKKAPLLTLRAFVEATEHLPQAHLTMIGDGPLLSKARAMVAEMGAEAKVSLPGALPHDEVREALQSSALFLQHSVTGKDGNTEGLPTSIQEAMACGCLVVSTRHAGIPEAVTHGETGMLVEEHDADGFTQAIRQMLELSPEQQSAMAAEARGTAEARFDNARLLTKLEDVISETLSRPAR
ncbi:glycosyltransferase [Pseudaestuariivita sp.]|uniref:glycosyltransferase n=1 Tax=Pseudaestuariivita sp. TaxID=2211669 RepID=UPI0040582ECD